MTKLEGQTLKTLDEQILEVRAELRELNRQQRERKLNEKPPEQRKRGRKKLSDELIEKAKELAKSKTITSVAFKLNIGMTSLYKYGIKRKILNAEKAIEANNENKK